MFGAQTRSPAKWGGDRNDPPKRLRYTPGKGKVPEFSEFPRWGPCRTILLVWEKKTKKSANILKLEVDRFSCSLWWFSKFFFIFTPDLRERIQNLTSA